MSIVDDIKNNGYALLPDLISEDTCNKYKEKLIQNFSNYRNCHAKNSNPATHGLDDKSNEQVVYNLHNKSHDWFRFFEHSEILSLLDVLLVEGSYKNSDPYYLNNISARCPLRGNKPQQLHIDSRIAGLNRSLIVNVLWMIDDFTAENGATRVVPGSHKYTQFAEDGKDYPEEITVTGKRGSALIFDAGLWHGGGANINGESRWALVLGYARWFIKPAFDYMHNTPTKIYDAMSDRQRRLLGFDLVPPMDEFTRVRRRCEFPEVPFDYSLPPCHTIETA